jgi:hypothetical protein
MTRHSRIHQKIHELEVLLAHAMNHAKGVDEKQNLEHAHDILVHQVTEYVRSAEKEE